MAACSNIEVFLDSSSGTYTLTMSDIENAGSGSSDNCAVSSLAVNRDTFDCSDAGGSVSIELTVSDASGNSDNCLFDVAVHDLTAPVALCSGTIASGLFFRLCVVACLAA